jgi:hypothetical protein
MVDSVNLRLPDAQQAHIGSLDEKNFGLSLLLMNFVTQQKLSHEKENSSMGMKRH